MAKIRKIKNMTRAEHKRALEKAVGLQSAAVREMMGQVFLPKLNRRDGKHDGDVYAQVLAAGQEVLEKCRVLPGSRSERIISYYSRKDVQQAMFQYAKGRKISVLRNFRPMFRGSQLRKPDDILPIMMFYSQEPKLYPSIHGTVSRQDGSGRQVCDLVVEVDFKKSRSRSFNLSRPIIRLFQDLGLEFRVKFSGNASPHIIIPAEAFPRSRRKVSSCRNLYGKLLDFLRKQIKQPKTLDGSFRNPNHFLRMPYSINENTGLVSVPIRIEDFDRFSWEIARPESVVVIEDWWSIPEDASERTEKFIEMALGERTLFVVNSDLNKSAQEILAPQMPDVLGAPIQMGMVKAGEEIAACGNALMKEPSMKEVLHELQETASDISQDDAAARWQIAHSVAQKYDVNRENVRLLWQWSDRADALAYYSRLDVQEAIYSYTRGRCVRLEGMDEYITLNEPSDIPALAAYMIGGDVVPIFQCTNAMYDPESIEMIACDMVIQVDQELSNAVVLLFRAGNIPSFVLYNGGTPVKMVIPFEVLKAGINLDSPLSRLPDIAEAFNRYLRRMLKTSDGVHVCIYESSSPIPYSLAGDGERANLPVKLEDITKLSPDTTLANAVGIIEKIESFIPPDAEEKAAKFFVEAIL